jgi:hypothetical protein
MSTLFYGPFEYKCTQSRILHKRAIYYDSLKIFLCKKWGWTLLFMLNFLVKENKDYLEIFKNIPIVEMEL